MALAVLFLSACGGDGSSATTDEGGAQTDAANGDGARSLPAPSGEAVRSAKVEIVDFEYSPATVIVQSGGKVTWLNQDTDEHTATLDDGSFSTGALTEGKLKSEPFKTAGTYPYHCEIHPQMTGAVEVVEPS